jgi:hypothetical protein
MVMANTRTALAGPELEEAVERQITQRTWGRVHHLLVEQRSDRVVIHGHSPTYYVKQLALSAAQEVCPTVPVELDIQVGADDNYSVEARYRP